MGFGGVSPVSLPPSLEFVYYPDDESQFVDLDAGLFGGGRLLWLMEVALRWSGFGR